MSFIIWPLMSLPSQVMETTNDVLDHSLFKLVTHEAAMSYHRVFVANLLANDGPEWVDWVKVSGPLSHR